MNTTSSVVLTGSVVAAGHWSVKKKVPIRVFVGMAVLAIFLAAMAEANAALAERFALLVLVAALVYYALPIAKGLGFAR